MVACMLACINVCSKISYSTSQLDVCCCPLSWKQNKMAAKQHVNNSSLYQMLCTYNLFDHWNEDIITLSKFCQSFFIILFVIVLVICYFKKLEMPESLRTDSFSGSSELKKKKKKIQLINDKSFDII